MSEGRRRMVGGQTKNVMGGRGRGEKGGLRILDVFAVVMNE